MSEDLAPPEPDESLDAAEAGHDLVEIVDARARAQDNRDLQADLGDLAAQAPDTDVSAAAKSAVSDVDPAERHVACWRSWLGVGGWMDCRFIARQRRGFMNQLARRRGPHCR